MAQKVATTEDPPIRMALSRDPTRVFVFDSDWISFGVTACRGISGVSVDIQIYKLEENDGWTLKLVVGAETFIAWTHLLATDRRPGTNCARNGGCRIA